MLSVSAKVIGGSPDGMEAINVHPQNALLSRSVVFQTGVRNHELGICKSAWILQAGQLQHEAIDVDYLINRTQRTQRPLATFVR